MNRPSLAPEAERATTEDSTRDDPDPDPDGNLAWARAIAKADALVALSHEVRASAEKRSRFKQAAGAYADPRSRASRTTHERERAAEGVAKEMGVEVPVAAQTTPAEPVEETASTPAPRSTAKHTAKTGTLGKSASFKSDGSDASVGDSAGGTAGGRRSLRKPPANLKPQKRGDVLDMWDEKGNIRVAKALTDTTEPSEVDPSSTEVSITPDQYRLLYLISRLQSVSFEAPKKVGSIELTRNEISSGGGSPSRTSSADSLDRLQSLAARVREESEGGGGEEGKSELKAHTNVRKPGGILGNGGGRVAPAPDHDIERSSSHGSSAGKTVTIRDESPSDSSREPAATSGDENEGSKKPHRQLSATSSLWKKAVGSVVKTMKLRHTLSRSFQHVPSTMRELQDKASTRWVHRTPLLVYIYEGILLEIFETYDFYPGSEISGVCKGVLNMNVSTEAIDDLSDLQEMGLVLRLKLGTKDHFTTTSYQVMPAGVAALKSMSQRDKNDVDRFLVHSVRVETPQLLRATHYDPHDYAWWGTDNDDDDDLREIFGDKPEFTPFEISFDAVTGEFNLLDAEGNERVSTVTEFEDVSYVCSPYLPSCVRPKEGRHSTNRQFSDFSSLAHLAAEGTHTMRDADIRHHVFLNNITLLSSQYLVNGPNEVNSLNEKLSLHASRVEMRKGQAGLVSAQVDHSPASTVFDVAMSGMCAIFPMDYVRSTMANFESKVYLPEDPGVVQLENFGIHLHSNGEVIFGVKVESVMNNVRDNIPIDLIARIVFDLHEDSASTLSSISSSHQRLLMASLRGTQYVNEVRDENQGSSRKRNRLDIGASRNRKRVELTGSSALDNVIDNLTAVGSKVSGVAASIASVPRQVRDQVMSGLVQKKASGEARGDARGNPRSLRRAVTPSQLARSSMSPVIRDSSIKNPALTRQKSAVYDSDDDGSSVFDSDEDDELMRTQQLVKAASEQHAFTASKYAFNMFTAFFCDSITPSVSAKELMDGEDFENDIIQIIGRITSGADLPGGGIVLSGEKGLIVSGPAGRKFEQLIVVHCSVMARRIFVSEFFHRLFEMESEIDAIQVAISAHIGKPSQLSDIRRRVMEACKQASLLDSLLTQCRSSSSDLPDISQRTMDKGKSDPAYDVLLETLNTQDYREELVLRLKDLESLLQCARLGLDSLRENTDVISEMQMFKLQESLQSNTRNLESLFRSNESASSSLQIMQLVIGGSLGFAILDRMTGEWSALDTPWGQTFWKYFVDPAGVWFVVSMTVFVVIVVGLHITMKAMIKQASADMCLRYSLHVRVNLHALRQYLKARVLFSEEAETDVEGNNMYKVSWDENKVAYGGSSLRVSISVDQGHARLCTVTLQYNRREGSLSVPDVQDKFLRELVDARVIVDESELGDLIRPEAHTLEERVRMAIDEQRSKDRARKLRKRGEDRQAVRIIERRAIKASR